MNKKITFPVSLFIFIFVLANYTVVSLSVADPVKSPGSFLHHVWTNDNGLPINTVVAIDQTPDGYLWLGTEAGLARFDGIKFEVFSHENTPAFSSSLIAYLVVDRSGTLWIVTQFGGIVRYQNRRFEAFARNSPFLNTETWCVMESTDNSIWIGNRKGLCRFNRAALSQIALPESLSTHVVRTIIEDRNGRIWVGTNDGLVLVKKRGNRFETEHIGLKGIEIFTLFEDRKGSLWIGTQENGLFRYWGEQMRSFTTNQGLTDNTVRALYEDRFGNLWIGTNAGGIDILPSGIESNRSKSGAPPIFAFPKPEEFTSGVITSFYEDREGTLWIGTNGGGLYNLRESKITTYTNKNGLSFNNVYGVFQDSSGRVWVGTKGYGANYFDFEDNRFHTLTTRSGLSSDSVVSFAQDLTGSLWFGTLGGGINRYKNGNIKVFDHRHGLSSNLSRAVYVDPEGNIWAATIKGTIYRFVDNRFKLALDVKFRVNTLYKDSKGNFWAGTLGNGLLRLDMEKGTFEVFNEKKGLSNNVVSCIHEDAKGILWIGTLNGLNRFQDGDFTALSQKHGLPDDTVYWILEDHKHDFWISSNRGIYCISCQEIDDFFKGKVDTLKPSVYGKEAGMRSVECNGGNHPAGWKTHNGKLWFPTTYGVSVIDPVNIGINKVPPPLVIEKIVISGKDYPVTQTVTVSPGKNHIEVHYTALSFIVPKKIRFKYKMEGYEKKWVDAGANRSAYYNDLPPGEYRFQVIACNSDGVWNDSGATIRFHLKASFYQTPPFIILLAVILVLTLLLYCYFKKCKLRPQLTLKRKTMNASAAPESGENKKCIQKLFYLVEEEKVYKDPNLTIKFLASKLLISPRSLSRIINNQLNTNFYEFINEYRIKEAQQMLSAPGDHQESILEIAYEVGYNSKSAFNRAFKNFTGMTPSEFRKKPNNNQPGKNL
jgi:ligand-binding sensor domain-containing protein/AraC-like DNA-binding protein